MLKVYISGVHSDPNPSAGLGVARSLRDAYPDIYLVAVDYSPRSTGLHSELFNNIWLQRPWNELDLAEYKRQIENLLDSGAYWISTLDLEISWLVTTLDPHPHLLMPTVSALREVSKPHFPAHRYLPMQIPPYVPMTASTHALHAFCREHGWPIWVKGPYYEARKAYNWTQVQLLIQELSRVWSSDEIYLQAHIEGQEECIVYSAYKGEILDGVHMTKLISTIEGKTWGGRVSKIPTYIVMPLQEVVSKLNWTGGAEIECVRDTAGILWLIDWNPRFPGWIYGATIAGHNLPAALLERCTGSHHIKPMCRSVEFVRVVEERPAILPIPLAEVTPTSLPVTSKHPSGMPLLAKQVSTLARHPSTVAISPEVPKVAASVMEDLSSLDLEKLTTPAQVFLKTTASNLFDKLACLIKSTNQPKIRIAYSIKTNPDERLLRLALEHDMFAEAISQLELHKAISVGFRSEDIILNGPGKWWPSKIATPSVKAVFCDSMEELTNYLAGEYPAAEIVGIRLKPPALRSRFGIPLEDFATFRDLITLLAQLPSRYHLGIHCHIASNTIGIHRWWRLVFMPMITWAQVIEELTKRPIKCMDIGGGWFPEDIYSFCIPQLHDLFGAMMPLKHLDELIIQPGRALAQPTLALATRVLELRHPYDRALDIVVDGSIAELPEAAAYPHSVIVFTWQNREWQVLGKGDSQILGRLCMENDILAQGIRIPDNIQRGDIVVFCDAGAYDRSMSYVFGQG